MNYIRYSWGLAENTDDREIQSQEPVEHDISSSPTLSPPVSSPQIAAQGKPVHETAFSTNKHFDTPSIIDAQDDLNKLVQESNAALFHQKTRFEEAHAVASTNINSKLQTFSDGVAQELQKMLRAINQEAEVSFLERKAKIEGSFLTQLHQERNEHQKIKETLELQLETVKKTYEHNINELQKEDQKRIAELESELRNAREAYESLSSKYCEGITTEFQCRRENCLVDRERRTQCSSFQTDRSNQAFRRR